MAGVALAIAAVSIWLLYEAAFEQEKARLSEAAQSQARLIEAVARFDAKHSESDHPEGAAAATLGQVEEAHRNYRGFGETGEFTLAKRRGDEIVFLLRHRHTDLEKPRPVSWLGETAEPMRRALQGLSGTVLGLDYRGATVLAAHEPVAILNLGIVAKIDLAEIRAPFIRAAMVSLVGGVFIVLVGGFLLRRAMVPILERSRIAEALRESEDRFRDFAESASDWLWEMGPDLAFTYGSDRFYEITGWHRQEVYGQGREFLVHPELEDLASEKWREHFAKLNRHEPFNSFEYAVRGKQGSFRYVSLSGVPVLAPDGIFLGYRGTGSDITERRQAEDARHESEEKYRSIFDNAQVGLIRARISDGRPLDANERLAEILGYRDRADAISNHREDNHWAYQSEREAWIAEGEENGFVRNFDGTLLRKDGSTVHIRSSATFYPEQGYIDVVMLDQTEQKLAEDALRENEKRYLEMFNRAHVGLARKRISDGKLLEANERMAEIYGYASREELLAEINPARHWRDAASRGEVLAEGLRSGGGHEIEAQHIRKDGSAIWVRLSTDYFPELDYIEITNVDITEQKLAEQALHESEDRYRILSDLTSEGVAILEDGIIVEANQAFAQMYGYSVSELVGKPVLELTIPEHSQEVADRMKSNQSDAYESISFRKDGSKIPIEIKAAPFVYKGRQMRVSRMRDLTEAHQAAAAVRDSEERLRQAQKIEAVGQLTGGIAHDFNNILAAVIGNLDLIEDETIANLSDKEAIATALDAALRGAELTHRLLAFSRQQALDAKDIQINEILPRFLQLATRTIGANIAVETKLADDLYRAMTDVGQLESALLNLVINARDAMPEGGRLTIETANQVLTEDDTAAFGDLMPGDYVMIAVGDDGCGMPAEVREKAFEPFFTTKDVGAGSGLGLSMVFGFARQSGGQVMIDSAEGKGTTVRIYLPRLAAGANVERTVEDVEKGRLEGKETILVVEDEKDVLAYVARALGNLGYTVLQAEDGPAALEVMAVCGSIDLLLTDVILPRGMNGREVATAFRAQNPGAAVLYSSGYTRDILDNRGQLDEGVALMNKPFRPRALARQVREILDSRK